MPELPEVETVRRGLVSVMEGHTITKVDVNRPDLRWPFPNNMADRLTGQKVTSLRRRSTGMSVSASRTGWSGCGRYYATNVHSSEGALSSESASGFVDRVVGMWH